MSLSPLFLVLKVRETNPKLCESNSNLDEIHSAHSHGVQNTQHMTLSLPFVVLPFHVFLGIAFYVPICSSLPGLPFSYLSSFPWFLLLTKIIWDFLWKSRELTIKRTLKYFVRQKLHFSPSIKLQILIYLLHHNLGSSKTLKTRWTNHELH